MVAPSFQTMTVMSEVYMKNNKAYIDVKNEKTGTIRSVRWYTEAEYKKAYGNKSQENAAGGKSGFSGLIHARGFSNGPIVVVRGAVAANEQWLAASTARYATDIGWYFVSTEPMPEKVPSTLKGVLLSWEEMKGEDDRHVKAPAALQKIIADKIKQNRDIVRFSYE